MSEYAFMFSNLYSGATLFAILLNNHKEITCNGETFPLRPNDIDIYRCSCGNELRSCEFYKEVAAHMLFNEKHPEMIETFSVLPKFSRVKIVDKWLKSYNYLPKVRDAALRITPNYRKKNNCFAKNHQLFYEKCCNREGTKIYVDGTKSMRRAEIITGKTRSSNKIIYLIRDGRGFCYSYLKHSKIQKEKIERAAEAWCEHIRIVDIFRKRYPEINILIVRYEDLCRNIVRTFQNICEFLELKSHEISIGDIEKEHHILGNVMRKKFDGKIVEDLSWKKNLTREEKKKAEIIMGENLTRFGYL